MYGRWACTDSLSAIQSQKFEANLYFFRHFFEHDIDFSCLLKGSIALKLMALKQIPYKVTGSNTPLCNQFTVGPLHDLPSILLVSVSQFNPNLDYRSLGHATVFQTHVITQIGNAQLAWQRRDSWGQTSFLLNSLVSLLPDLPSLLVQRTNLAKKIY